MKICNKCGSPDVAQSVWNHLNTIGLAPMDPTFYWCFSCNKDTVVIDKSSTVLGSRVTMTTNINKEPSEIIISSVSAHFRETPIDHRHHDPQKQIEYHTDTWKFGGCYTRYWMLKKNAKKAESKGMKVDWEDE